MEPLIALTLDRNPRVYQSGQPLRFEYQIDAVAPQRVQAIEASVLWLTEGKGEPDMGVHFFRRTTRDEYYDRDLRPMQRVEVELPHSPLSYDGVILKIRWCVRVRLFLAQGREYLEEQSFTLGNIPSARPVDDADQPAATGDERSASSAAVANE